MSKKEDLARLTAIFRELGAREPEQWARSEIEEGIPQLARYVFLRQAWGRSVPDDGDTAWIDQSIKRAEKRPDTPYAGEGLALARCLAAGATKEDLAEIARCAAAKALFGLAYQMEGADALPDGMPEINWGLFLTDEDGEPTGAQINGLHESVLETDPTGREMRPKPRT